MDAKEFRKKRRMNDYTQQQVADYCSVSKSAICKFEKDKIVISEGLLNKILEFANEYLL